MTAHELVFRISAFEDITKIEIGENITYVETKVLRTAMLMLNESKSPLIKQRLLSYMNEETAELITTEILSLINGNDIQK